MKLLRMIAALSMFLPLANAEEPLQRCQRLMKEAGFLTNSEPKQAETLYREALAISVEAHLPAYADYIGAQICFLVYGGGHQVDTAECAKSIAAQLETLPRPSNIDPNISYLEVLGFVERGYEAEGKISQALAANAKIARLLLQNTRSISQTRQPPQSLSAESLLQLPTSLWGIAARNMHREATLQSYLGNNVDAIARLDALHHLAFTKTRFVGPSGDYYIAKALATRAVEMDFLGYSEAAIAAEKELIQWCKQHGQNPQNMIILQLNHLRNLSQWYGPSLSYINEFRELAETEKKPMAKKSHDRLLAKMEADLQNSQDIQKRLDAIVADDTKNGKRMEALYAERDALLNRAGLSDEDLSMDFRKLLATMRLQGNLRGICSLKQEYGDYLASRGTMAEALQVLHDSLADAKRFGWHMRSVSIISSLLDVYLKTGNDDAARVMMAELADLLARDGILIGKSRILAHYSLFTAHCHFSEKDLAETHWSSAVKYATTLPAYQGRYLTQKIHDELLKAAPSPVVPASIAGADAISLSPISKSSLLPIGKSGKTFIEICNHSAQAQTISVALNGPIVSSDAKTHETRFTAGKISSLNTFPLTIAAGMSQILPLHFTPTGDTGHSEISCVATWTGAGAATHQARSIWQIHWGEEANARTVIDASYLHNDLFRAVSLWHQFHLHSLDRDDRMSFRFRSTVDRRIEYYTQDDQLLAIDNNGNGIFTDEGDMALATLTDAAALLADDLLHARIYPSAAAMDKNQSTLHAEVKRNGKWVPESENIITW